MAAKKNAGPVQIQAAVELNPGSFEFLSKNANGDLAGTIAEWAGYYIDRQARGGLFLEPEDHDHLAKLRDGKRFRNSREVTKAIEGALRREDGQFTFQVAIDPAFIQPLQEFADTSGMTLAELVQNGFAMVLASNWLYDLTPADGRMLPLSAATLAKIAALRGKQAGYVDSTDVDALATELVDA